MSGDRGLVAGQPAEEAEAKAEGPSWNRDHIVKTSSGHLRWQVVQADTWATSSHRHGKNGADELEAADGGNWAPQGRSMRDGRRAFAPCDQRFWGGDRHASCVTWQQLAPLFLQVPPEVEGEDGAVVGLDGSRQQPTLTRDSRFSGSWGGGIHAMWTSRWTNRNPIASQSPRIMLLSRWQDVRVRNCPLSPTQLVPVGS